MQTSLRRFHDCTGRISSFCWLSPGNGKRYFRIFQTRLYSGKISFPFLTQPAKAWRNSPCNHGNLRKLVCIQLTISEISDLSPFFPLNMLPSGNVSSTFGASFFHISRDPSAYLLFQVVDIPVSSYLVFFFDIARTLHKSFPAYRLLHHISISGSSASPVIQMYK